MCPFRVRVSSACRLGDFLGSLLTTAVSSPEGSLYCQVRHGLRHLTRFRLPTLFNGRFRRPAGVSLLRLPVAAESSAGMLTGSSIGSSLRMPLRSRLTLIRLALIRNPWSYGEEVSRLLYRYLYLHLLFRQLHNGSNLCFAAAGMLPYQLTLRSIPRLRHRTYARLLSTRLRSTSELLRTL